MLPGQGVCPPSAALPHRGSVLSPGDLLIIMAQIIVSVQMVLEEKFVYKHNVHPLRAVGTEGECGASHPLPIACCPRQALSEQAESHLPLGPLQSPGAGKGLGR